MGGYVHECKLKEKEHLACARWGGGERWEELTKSGKNFVRWKKKKGEKKYTPGKGRPSSKNTDRWSCTTNRLPVISSDKKGGCGEKDKTFSKPLSHTFNKKFYRFGKGACGEALGGNLESQENYPNNVNDRSQPKEETDYGSKGELKKYQDWRSCTSRAHRSRAWKGFGSSRRKEVNQEKGKNGPEVGNHFPLRGKSGGGTQHKHVNQG